MKQAEKNAIVALMHDPNFDPSPWFTDALYIHIAQHMSKVLEHNPELVSYLVDLPKYDYDVSLHIEPQSEMCGKWLQRLAGRQYYGYQEKRAFSNFMNRISSSNEIKCWSDSLAKLWTLCGSRNAQIYWESLSDDDRKKVINQIGSRSPFDDDVTLRDWTNRYENIIDQFSIDDIQYFLHNWDGDSTEVYHKLGMSILKHDPTASGDVAKYYIKRVASRNQRVASFCGDCLLSCNNRSGYGNHKRVHLTNKITNVIDLWPGGYKDFKKLVKACKPSALATNLGD